MAHQKVFKKKKPWETPELIAARTECIRLHTVMKYPAGEIAKLVGKDKNQIRRWLIAANVFQRITPIQRVEKRNSSLEYAHRLIRKEYNREMTALKTIDRISELFVCKECGIAFKPKRGFQEFCGIPCRTKSYLKLNREVIAEKAKKKYDLFYKTHAERLYAAKNPKCNFCHDPIPFQKFFRRRAARFCSHKCSRKALSEKRKNDPIFAAAYKLIKSKTYQKRQLNGKNRLEKRKYLRNNIQARIAKNLRTRLYLAVKKQGGKKCDLTMSLTGADWPTFSVWIENKFHSGMTWDNYGRWHIDHVKACARFDLTEPEQQRECFHYTNLQPLWGLENIKKGSRIILPKTVFTFDR